MKKFFKNVSKKIKRTSKKRKGIDFKHIYENINNKATKKASNLKHIYENTVNKATKKASNLKHIYENNTKNNSKQPNIYENNIVIQIVLFHTIQIYLVQIL